MPTPTYTPLATVTLGTAAASVTFSNIPATYRDLILVINCQFSTSSSIRIRLNGDTGANYSGVRAESTSVSDSFSGLTFTPLQVSAYSGSVQLPFLLQFMDYSATDKHKTLLARPNSVASGVGMEAHRWGSTSAVNSILCYLSAGNYNSGSTFSLYGVIA